MNYNNKRQIFLDIETTGMNKFSPHYKGHRIIEIGAVEIINRQLTGRQFHVYLKPDRLIDLESFNVHGISDEFLINKPTFADVSNELIQFIKNSELIIHNAYFDVGFIDYEFILMNNNSNKQIKNFCSVTDSLEIAKKVFPNKRNSLDALCDRFLINRSKRVVHGALLDAKILSEIFLLMTSNQNNLNFLDKEHQKINDLNKLKNDIENQYKQNDLKIVLANENEILAHKNILKHIKNKHGSCLWEDLL